MRPDLHLDVKPDVKPGAKPDMKSEVKSEVKSDVKPGVKPDMKSEVKSDVKSDVTRDVESVADAKPAIERFYPIVDSAEWVRRLIPLGVQLIQLRIKDRPGARVRADVRAARDVCAHHAAQLVVNDHWRIAIDEGCDFVHLGQGDLETADVRAIRDAGIRIGVSTHDRAELDRALAIEPDYVALGPIYPTLLKVMPWAPQGLARISEWKRLAGDVPLVAIGGLSVERLPGVFAAGADSAAVITDIVRSEDPDARTREWVAAVSDARSVPGSSPS